MRAGQCMESTAWGTGARGHRTAPSAAEGPKVQDDGGVGAEVHAHCLRGPGGGGGARGSRGFVGHWGKTIAADFSFHHFTEFYEHFVQGVQRSKKGITLGGKSSQPCQWTLAVAGAARAAVVDGAIEELAPVDEEEMFRMLATVTMLVIVLMTLVISGMAWRVLHRRVSRKAAGGGPGALRHEKRAKGRAPGPETVDEMETVPAMEIVMPELESFEDVTAGSDEMGVDEEGPGAVAEPQVVADQDTTGRLMGEQLAREASS
ncbi:hypothetical protein CYMTET_17074 [Cymbomonas tetramitiformis]|uniref:Uncharacterized protein n=1 Tax=Cymbomonas tetramitiformis TaxID=36881 RepID=A0AAE0GAX9_9CHLO|nr:hypothetical protein CYMTET_17074 [Cymbomonas tetramitiformis]